MIHPTAILAPEVKLGERVEIGPYSVVDGPVVIGDDCRIGPHVHVSGNTTIGAGTVIHAGAVIGDTPQDTHYDGSVSYTDVGKACHIREYVTIHRGSAAGSRTVIGDNSMLMAFVHIAHNCLIDDHVVIANGSILGGHVTVGRRAFISALVPVHQFCRIGTLAIIGGFNRILQDVPPYCMVQEGGIQGANVVGLRRAGFGPELRLALRGAIRLYFFSSLNRPNAIASIRERYQGVPEIDTFVEFVSTTKRGILRGRQTGEDDGSEGAS